MRNNLKKMLSSMFLIILRWISARLLNTSTCHMIRCTADISEEGEKNAESLIKHIPR